MWLATKYGFYSVVAHQDDPDLVQVRARSRDDLEHLRGFAQGRGIPVPDIIMTPANDYCCRIFMTRRSWTQLGGALATEIDYPNFKEQVRGEPLRNAAYTQMWSAMRTFQIQQQAAAKDEFWAGWSPDDWDDEPEEWDEDEVFDFLDTLRDSGVTNMFGARPYLQETFGFDQDTAAGWLTRWMESYGRRHGLEAQT